jgi:hypothetical protein
MNLRRDMLKAPDFVITFVIVILPWLPLIEEEPATLMGIV